ncbi:MAG: ATP-dependent helicase [Flavobacteriia bacterium]|nr:MAG: ATP-dependent helicase [Flavobacteriia bacterium]
MQFNEFDLNKNILKAVAESDYQNPTQVQEKTIPEVLKGKDVIVSAQTGSGKTAAFALPILQMLYHNQHSAKKSKKIRALIVCPTRELALQIDESFKTYGKNTGLRATSIFGGVSIEPQKDLLKKGVDILIATPGRLLDLYKQELINPDYVEVLVLDEADLMLDMGFWDDVKKIEKICPEDKQVLLFSATIPDKVIHLAQTIMDEPVKIVAGSNSVLEKEVDQLLYYVPKQRKIELCLHLLRNTVKGSTIIFRRTKFGVDKLEKTLLKNKYKVASIHGDKSQNVRQEALQKFKNREADILIATDVASRGLDIKNLDNVINFDIPSQPEIYVHRIGRTGRAGEKGVSYSFCSADEKNYIAEIQKLIHKEIFVIEDHPYPLDPKSKPEIHKKRGSKYKKGRKSAASKKKKKRWY